METSYCSKKGRSINSSDPEWLSIPHLSLIIDDDDVEAFKEFVRRKPDCIGWRRKEYSLGWYPGWGPVEYAMLRDSFNVFRELLRLEGTTTETLPLYPYRLYDACYHGRLDMVQLLLDHVGDLQDALARTDERGGTPLLVTTGTGRYSDSDAIMQLLLGAGGNPLQELHSADRWAEGSDWRLEESQRRQGIETPFLVANILTTAMGFASPSLIERLFHAGVDIFAGGSYIYYKDPRWEIHINVTPLHRACGRSSVERVQTLLRLAGSDAARMLAQRDSMGRTPIHWLILGEGFNYSFGNWPSPLRDRTLHQIKQCIQVVRANDLEMAAINSKDGDGKTAMHLAAESHLPELATYLLEQGANPNLTDSTGRTPLMALVINSFKRQETRKPVINAIIGAVDSINAVDNHGDSALHLACSHYTRLWTANILIEQGALCHIANGSGQTPLHKAAACLWRPSLNHCNFKSYYDAEQSQDRVVALLLENCHDLCNMGSKDFSGRCPADILAETRLRASEYIEDEVREEVKSKLERINDAYIRAGFHIMPPGIQDLVETAGGNLALRTTDPSISLRTSLRTGMGRGRGALMTPPVFLTIPPHRRRISFESTAFN